MWGGLSAGSLLPSRLLRWSTEPPRGRLPFFKLEAVDPGFKPEHILLTSVDLRNGHYPPERRAAVYREMLQHLRAIPGVLAASDSNMTPISELPGGIASEIGYVGSRSKHMTLGYPSINENALNPSLLSLGSALTQSVANPFYGHGGLGVVGTANVTEAQLLLPYPTYGSISELFTDNNKAKYDSLVLKASKTYKNGVTFFSGFTWSRNWDESSGGVGNTLNSGTKAPQNPYNIASEYSFSNIDSPFRWSSSVSYVLPVGKGKMLLGNGGPAAYVLGGWVINSVSIMRGPGQVNWDMSVFKNFVVKEKLKAQFRAEALNAMNTPVLRPERLVRQQFVREDHHSGELQPPVADGAALLVLAACPHACAWRFRVGLGTAMRKHADSRLLCRRKWADC
jgi:hypothetical protein